jgi:hypothetical protein
MTPCTEETARLAIERMIPVPVKVLSVPAGALITAGAIEDEQDPDYDDE